MNLCIILIAYCFSAQEIHNYIIKIQSNKCKHLGENGKKVWLMLNRWQQSEGKSILEGAVIGAKDAGSLWGVAQGLVHCRPFPRCPVKSQHLLAHDGWQLQGVYTEHLTLRQDSPVYLEASLLDFPLTSTCLSYGKGSVNIWWMHPDSEEISQDN